MSWGDDHEWRNGKDLKGGGNGTFQGLILVMSTAFMEYNAM
jgi:hypothetical protein